MASEVIRGHFIDLKSIELNGLRGHSRPFYYFFLPWAPEGVMNLIAATEAAPIACGMLVNKPVRPASAAPAAGAVAAVGPELTVPIREEQL